MKALVLTRATTPPKVITRFLEAMSFISPHFAEAPNTADLEKLITTEKPSLILIDGEYDLLDGQRWSELSKLKLNELRVQLLEKDAKELPTSLKLLKYCHALKKKDVSIFIFIEKPSATLIAELIRLGATLVWKSNNSLSANQEAIFDIIRGTKGLAGGLGKLGRNLVREIAGSRKK